MLTVRTGTLGMIGILGIVGMEGTVGSLGTVGIEGTVGIVGTVGILGIVGTVLVLEHTVDVVLDVLVTVTDGLDLLMIFVLLFVNSLLLFIFEEIFGSCVLYAD